MSISKNLRGLLALMLTVGSGSAFAEAVTVVEFHNTTLDAYFITGRLEEQQLLDRQAQFRRTGMTFAAVSAIGIAPSSNRICRFYINLATPPTSSHFYGREGVDCEQIDAQHYPGFSYEGYDFALTVAQPQGGLCPSGTKTVYRGFRKAVDGKTPNHRYTTSPETYNAARNDGYDGEGAVFCASSATDVTPTVNATQKCGTFYYPSLRISYQSLTTTGIADGFVSYLNGSKESFNGQPQATAVVEVNSGLPTVKTFINDGPDTWALLGYSATSNNGDDNLYYTKPTVYPRDFLPGQEVSVNSQLTYSKANSLGTVVQTGSVKYIGPEAVTVPYGSFLSTCKFSTQLVTTFSGTNETTTTSMLTWVADRFGVVKSIKTTETTSPSNPVARVSTTTVAVYLQPF